MRKSTTFLPVEVKSTMSFPVSNQENYLNENDRESEIAAPNISECDRSGTMVQFPGASIIPANTLVPSLKSNELISDKLSPSNSVEHTAEQDLSNLGTDTPLIPTFQKRVHPQETQETNHRERSSKQVRNFRLIKPLGKGGMGMVYLAEQRFPIQREVALKIVQNGSNSQAVLARFDMERRVLALMNHPHIANILDAGTSEDGEPYFVMELIPDALPLIDFCDKNHLTITERLDLFVKICLAIQHAHQKGIIHRDLKPSNILVTLKDGITIPKVIDFGIAKAIQKGDEQYANGGITFAGHVVGTLEYMSPEQAGDNPYEIDTRSDIYSLGIILCEILTGTTPRRKMMNGHLIQIVEKIQKEEITGLDHWLNDQQILISASTRSIDAKKLKSIFQGDLQAIVCKALRKNPAERYQSVNEFVQDIISYQKGEPIKALPITPWYFLQKRLKKYRHLISAVFALLIIVLIFIIMVLRHLYLEDFTEQLQMHNQQIEREKKVSEESSNRAEALIHFVENEIFSAARPRDQEGGLGVEVKLLDALKNSEKQIPVHFANQPVVELSLRKTLGKTYYYIGKFPEALEQFEREHKLAKIVYGEKKWRTMDAGKHVAMAHRGAGHYLLAESILEQLQELATRELGPYHVETLTIQNQLANTYEQIGKFKQALDLDRSTLEIRKKFIGPSNPQTLNTQIQIANCLLKIGEPEQAIPLLNDTLSERGKLLGADHPDTLAVWISLGIAYRDTKNYSEANRCLQYAYKHLQAKLGDSHPQTLNCMNQQAIVLGLNKEYNEGRILCEKVLQLRIKSLGSEHPDVAESETILGRYFFDEKRFTEAIPYLEDALRIRRKTVPNSWMVMNTLYYLGQCKLELKEYDIAEKYLTESLAGFQAQNKAIPGYLRERKEDVQSALIRLYRSMRK